MSTIHTMIQLFQNQAMFKLVKELKTCKKNCSFKFKDNV